MKRWFWRVLLVVAAMAALTVGVMAEEYNQQQLDRDQTLKKIGDIIYQINGNNATLMGYFEGSAPSGEKGKNFTIPDSIIIPETEEEKTVTGIADSAFYGCSGLTETLTIGNNITSIGSHAFEGCGGITEVIFPDGVSDIGEYAFHNCTELYKVVVPKGLTGGIKAYTFSNCAKLEQIYLPSSIRSIDSLAFVGVINRTLHIGADIPDAILNNLKSTSGLTFHRALESVAGTPENPVATCVKHGLQANRYNCVEVFEVDDGSQLGCGLDFNQNRPTPLKPDNHAGNGDLNYWETNPEDLDTESTCSTQGWEPGTICKYCKAVLQPPTRRELDPEKHEGEIVDIDATEATCTEPAYMAYQEYSICHHNPDGEEKTIDPEQPTPLGHDYGENNFYTVDLVKLVNDAKTLKGYKDCEEFDINLGSRTFQCVRYDKCRTSRTISDVFSEDLGVELSNGSLHIDLALDEKLDGILGRTDHAWDGEWGGEAPESASDPRVLDEYVTDDGQRLPQLASCANGGQDELFAWKSICQLCEQQGGEVKYVRVPWDGTTHTYHSQRKDTITMPVTCWHDGYTVTYLVCDGDHTMTAVCDHKYHEECSVGDGIQCDDLLHRIETAVKNFEDEIKQSGTISPAAQKEVNDAFTEYRAHLDKHEEANEDNDCVVEIKWLPSDELDKEQTGTHIGPFINEETTRTGLNGEDYYDCTTGYIETTTATCLYCDTENIIINQETVDPHDHTPPEDAEGVEELPATCTEPKRIQYPGGTICTECERPIGGDPVPVVGSKPLGHDWVFESDEVQEDHCRVVTGRVHCSREYEEGCGATSETRTIAVSGLLGHTWGDWITTKQPTATEEGEETHYCEVCYKYDETAFETRKIPATGVPDDGDDDDGSGGSGSGGSGSGGGTTTPDTNYYTISTSTDGHGRVSTSVSSARSGTRVTVYVYPDSGYEVDKVRVTGSTFGTDLSNGWYYFTMPAENVTVTATFSRVSSSANVNWTGSATSSSQSSSTTQNVVQSVPKAGAWGQLFSDIPASHWAAGEINWANQMGYMNGTSGAFNPNGNITHQQMWMVLARLTGNNPANMADARRWAVNGGFADGSAPEGAVNRHQLVTALYRCAHLMGTSNRNTTSLAGFPDSRTVPAGARDAFAWAVANGIIGGNANGRLDPNGTLTRAQFAVILYRFSQRV